MSTHLLHFLDSGYRTPGGWSHSDGKLIVIRTERARLSSSLRRIPFTPAHTSPNQANSPPNIDSQKTHTMQAPRSWDILPAFSLGNFFQSHQIWPRSKIYVPLDTDRREIRLASIVPGRWSEDVCCNLKVVSLIDTPTYEALSYAWGDPFDKTPIFLNGLTFLITKNLHWALRRLRHSDETRYIWVDALCINQLNSKLSFRRSDLRNLQIAFRKESY